MVLFYLDMKKETDYLLIDLAKRCRYKSYAHDQLS